MDGQTHRLPLPAARPVRSPSQEELEYLVGFFDGDGCVTMAKSTGQVSLQISQNIDSSAVLLLFHSLLGGSIIHHSAATGTNKAVLQWRLFGSKMSRAAAALSTVPSMKQAQLLIASNGNVEKSDRDKVEQELKALKQKQHVQDQWAEAWWPYFAGFFDAEGSILVHSTRVGLRLEIKQVNPCALGHLQHFLHQNQLHSWTLHHRAAFSALVCQKLPDCKQTLQLLLEHGLLAKRQQAELALTLAPENHSQIREAISSLNGLQGRYKRLDSEGVARASEIDRLRKRLGYMPGPDHAGLQSQLELLCADHALQKLITHCNLLRKDMRQSLRQGGQVISS